MAAEITYWLAVALTVTPLLHLFGETVQEVPRYIICTHYINIYIKPYTIWSILKKFYIHYNFFIFNLVSHCAMRVESDSRRKRDVSRPPETPPETRLPAEYQRPRLAFRSPIITELQIITIITTIIITIIMIHRRLGFTTNIKIRKEFLITRQQITNILSLMMSETIIMTSRPTRSCIGGLT